MFYVGYHRPITTLLLYPGLGQAVNGALAELSKSRLLINNNHRMAKVKTPTLPTSLEIRTTSWRKKSNYFTPTPRIRNELFGLL